MVTTAPLAQQLSGWQPEPTVHVERLAPEPSAALAALLDLEECPGMGEPLPALWHWLYFLHHPRQSEVGPDGHPRSAHHVPPLDDRVRMFAGGRLHERAPLRIGADTELRTEVAYVTIREGSSGEMAFVTVRREYLQDGESKLTEEQDLMYRSGAPRAPRRQAGNAQAVRREASWRSPLVTDPVMLFRFSALTANAHRIHYDDPYTRVVEGYRGLVVHGPLLVLRMTELIRSERPDNRISALTYRFERPVHVGDTVTVTGEPSGSSVDLAVIDTDGVRSASGQAELS